MSAVKLGVAAASSDPSLLSEIEGWLIVAGPTRSRVYGGVGRDLAVREAAVSSKLGSCIGGSIAGVRFCEEVVGPDIRI